MERARKRRRACASAQAERVSEATSLPRELVRLIDLFLTPRLVVGLTSLQSSYLVTAACFSSQEQGWVASTFGTVILNHDCVQAMLLKGSDLFVVGQTQLFQANCITQKSEDVTKKHALLFPHDYNAVWRADQERGLLWRFVLEEKDIAWYDPSRPEAGCTPVILPQEFTSQMSGHLLVARNRIWTVQATRVYYMDVLHAVLSVPIDHKKKLVQRWPLPDAMANMYSNSYSFYDSPAGIVIEPHGQFLTCIFSSEGSAHVITSKGYDVFDRIWDTSGNRIRFSRSAANSTIDIAQDKEPVAADFPALFGNELRTFDAFFA